MQVYEVGRPGPVISEICSPPGIHSSYEEAPDDGRGAEAAAAAGGAPPPVTEESRQPMPIGATGLSIWRWASWRKESLNIEM